MDVGALIAVEAAVLAVLATILLWQPRGVRWPSRATGIVLAAAAMFSLTLLVFRASLLGPFLKRTGVCAACTPRPRR